MSEVNFYIFVIFELNIAFYVKCPSWGRVLRFQYSKQSPNVQEVRSWRKGSEDIV